jgi:hypothetical protein
MATRSQRERRMQRCTDEWGKGGNSNFSFSHFPSYSPGAWQDGRSDERWTAPARRFFGPGVSPPAMPPFTSCVLCTSCKWCAWSAVSCSVCLHVHRSVLFCCADGRAVTQRASGSESAESGALDWPQALVCFRRLVVWPPCPLLGCRSLSAAHPGSALGLGLQVVCRGQ